MSLKPLTVGEQINFWTLIGPSEQRTKDQRRMWVVQCRCGTVRVLPVKWLQLRKAINCGCVRGTRYATVAEQMEGKPSHKPRRKDSNAHGQSRAHLYPGQYVTATAVKRSKLCADLPMLDFKPLKSHESDLQRRRRLAEMVR